MPAEKTLNIVVTGSSGYVGKKVVQLLRNKNFKVIEIDKSLDKVAVQCKKYDQVQKLKSSLISILMFIIMIYQL
jgi:nucleoside-diphosphate-sugar epimerase